ncbi:MAG: hypothetical protein ACJ04Q_06745 [Flavobacteriales bacterium]
MKIEEVKTTIMQAFLKHTSINAQLMAYSPYKISNPQFYGFGKMLIDAGAVTKDDKTYTLIDKEKMAKAFGLDLPGETKKKVSKPTPTTIGRNTSQYVFEKVKRSKGRTVLAVVQAYVRDNKDVTYKQLLTVFPPQVKRFGTINILSDAKALSPDSTRPRYFFKEHQIITTKDKQQVVVCNQFIHSSFLEFVVLAKELGYVITPE